MENLMKVGITEIPNLRGEITGMYPMSEHGCMWVVTTEAVYKVTWLPWYKRFWKWFTDWRHA